MFPWGGTRHGRPGKEGGVQVDTVQKDLNLYIMVCVFIHVLKNYHNR